jgi:hypothetical protein
LTRPVLFGTGSIWELNILGCVLAVVAAVLLIGVAEGVFESMSARPCLEKVSGDPTRTTPTARPTAGWRLRFSAAVRSSAA